MGNDACYDNESGDELVDNGCSNAVGKGSFQGQEPRKEKAKAGEQ